MIVISVVTFFFVMPNCGIGGMKNIDNNLRCIL